MKIKKRFIYSFLFVVIVGGFAYFLYEHRTSAPRPLQNSTITFYGQIVDQDGKPMRADVDVQISEMVLDSNNVVDIGASAKKLRSTMTVSSGGDGAFLVIMRSPEHVLEILDVRSSGYTWLKDWAWSNGPPEEPTNNEMRLFEFNGTRASFPIYTSDSKNPAIFVLVSDGSDDPIKAKPSRGGSDRLNSGKIVTNKPYSVVMPSTGPGAPDGYAAIEDAIRKYYDQRNAAATRRSR